ncbi:hypothetical protein [Shinella zoogloeoides]|uniref:hypothetical protein n=1 Tax=Shinella zoogloeoides TaxID=352475 RepID=UPI0028AF8807|nr:hypothetical protein [Shinella zoogloeoides]
MIVSVSENRAALAPRRELTRRQQEAVLAIGHYRHIRKAGAAWEIGPHRFSQSIVDVLVTRQLAREASRSLSLTLAGQLVEKRLKDGQP